MRCAIAIFLLRLAVVSHEQEIKKVSGIFFRGLVKNIFFGLKEFPKQFETKENFRVAYREFLVVEL